MSKVQTPECHETGAAGWDRFLARRPALGVRSPRPRGIRGAVVRGSSLVWVQRVLPAPWSSHTVLPLNPRCPRKPAPRSRDSHRAFVGRLSALTAARLQVSPETSQKEGKRLPRGCAAASGCGGGTRGQRLGLAQLCAPGSYCGGRLVVPARCQRGALGRCLTPGRRRRPDLPMRTLDSLLTNTPATAAVPALAAKPRRSREPVGSSLTASGG